jgi:hypothetical protein
MDSEDDRPIGKGRPSRDATPESDDDIPIVPRAQRRASIGMHIIVFLNGNFV